MFEFNRFTGARLRAVVTCFLASAGAPALAQNAGNAPVTPDMQFVEIARQAPGFGGLFLDESGAMTIYLKGADARAALATQRAPKARALAAIGAVMGDRIPARLRAPMQSLTTQAVDAVKVLRADFDAIELYRVKEVADQALGQPGVVFTDIDEKRNRVVIGVENADGLQKAQSIMRASGAPAAAFVIEPARAFNQTASLSSRFRPAPGGVQIEADIGLTRYRRCTLGFNAERNGVAGFVTNSHCTKTRGASEGIDIHQPDDPVLSEGNKIGDEEIDPPYFSRAFCPTGFRCRFSDSAWIRYNTAPGKDIARTTNDVGSRTINSANPRLTIVSETAQPLMGMTLSKVGRSTGWTHGQVTATCVDTVVANTKILMRCQSIVTRTFGTHRITAAGDSGSPVFELLPNEQDVSLHGILWGEQEEGLRFVFSPMQSVQGEIGPLVTFRPPPPPPSEREQCLKDCDFEYKACIGDGLSTAFCQNMRSQCYAACPAQ